MDCAFLADKDANTAGFQLRALGQCRGLEDSLGVLKEIRHRNLIEPIPASVSETWKLKCTLFSKESPMPEKRDGICAHPACNCPVPQGEKYCSTYCEDAADTIEISCNCEHAGCAM